MRSKKKQIPGTIVAVEWFDANANEDWAVVSDRIKQHEDLIPAITVGIVLKHTDDYIILARTYQEDGGIVEGTFQILEGMIIDIHKLSYKNKITIE